MTDPLVGDAQLLRKVPGTYELAFYMSLAADPEIQTCWENFIHDINTQSNQLKNEVELGRLGIHAQVVYNSTANQLERLTKTVEQIRSMDKLYTGSSFLSIYNFFQNEKHRFHDVLEYELKLRRRSHYDNLDDRCILDNTLFSRYVKIHVVTQVSLDGIFNGKTFHLPKCLFRMINLEKLSLVGNHLRMLPADIGRLTQLRSLVLSRNRLKIESIPYSLTFCEKLEKLYLDNNSLDALPGFILQLGHLETVHRHDNQNYFRSTFMWYGCESRERIRTASFSGMDVDMTALALKCATEVQRLQFWAAKAVISSKKNYFLSEGLSEVTKEYISNVYQMFNICALCRTARLLLSEGYFVVTFENPYLGNTCVPFQHWTCSKECALCIEVPARHKQIQMAKQQVKAYNAYVKKHNREADISEEPSGSSNTTQPVAAADLNVTLRRPARQNKSSKCNVM